MCFSVLEGGEFGLPLRARERSAFVGELSEGYPNFKRQLHIIHQTISCVCVRE